MATIQDIMDWLNQGAQGDIPGTGGSQPNAPQASQGAGASQAQPVGDVEPFGGQGSAVIPDHLMREMQQNLQEMAPDRGGYDMYSPRYPFGVAPMGPMPPGKPANEASDQPPGATPVSEQKGYQAGQKAGQGLWAMLFGKQPQKTPQDYSGGIPPHLLDHYNALVESGLPPAVARSILSQPSVGEGEKPAGAGPWSSYSGWEQESQAAHSAPQRDEALSQHMWDTRTTQQQNLPTWEQNTPGDDDNLGFQRLPTGQYVPYPSQGLDYWAAQGNPSSFYWNPQPGSSWLNDLLGDQ